MGIKNTGATEKPSEKNFETFYLDGGIVQYFVKTQSLENEISKDHNFNVTIRKDGDKGLSVLLQISVFSEIAIGENPAVSISSKDGSTDGSEVDILFSEKKKGLFLTRIQGTLPYDKFAKALEDQAFVFEITPVSQSTLVLKPTKKAIKNIKNLQIVFLY